MRRIKKLKQKREEPKKLYIGIDNGTSGSIGWTDGVRHGQIKTPSFSEQSYTKAKGNISRVNHENLYSFLKELPEDTHLAVFVVVERPMVNPGRFKASVSALRSLESTLTVLERLNYPYQYLDSKEWQKDMLPKGIKGGPELKKVGLQIAKRLFPQVVCKPDADGILMAEWARRKRL